MLIPSLTSRGAAFLPIEEQLEWKLSAKVYAGDVAADVEQAIERIKQLNGSLTAYQATLTRVMEERKLILKQTHALLQEKTGRQQEKTGRQLEIEKLRSVLSVIERQAHQALASAAAAAAPDPLVMDVEGSTTETPSPAASAAPTDKLFTGIHFGNSECPEDQFPYSMLKRGFKKDKSGTNQVALLCPNCQSPFLESNDGKDRGLLGHLKYFKCPLLKHLRPPRDKRKPSGNSSSSDGGCKAARLSSQEEVDKELGDLVVQIKSRVDQESPAKSSLANLMQVSGV